VSFYCTSAIALSIFHAQHDFPRNAIFDWLKPKRRHTLLNVPASSL